VTEDWEESFEGDLQLLEEIRIAHADSVFKLLHWYAGNGLMEGLVVDRKRIRAR